MIRHIVMWKFREGTEEKANEFLTKLAALDGVIPQLKKCEVAKNIGKDNYDAVLVSEFETMDDLNAYKVDPRHVAVSDICKSIRADRVAVELNGEIVPRAQRAQTQLKGTDTLEIVTFVQGG